MNKINVIGAGLAGSECAFFLAERGYKVNLYEVRPSDKAPAHHTKKCAELVCSNSLKSNRLDNAAGLLKKEMEIMHSIVIESAYKNQVPAGQALAVDRELFSEYIDNKIRKHPNINFINKEIIEVEKDAITVICTGPLTTSNFLDNLKEIVGDESFSFYDASAPLIEKESINFDIAYYKSRYDQGDSKDYINCPFKKDQFDVFYKELLLAKKVELHEFEKDVKHFSACMPIEVIASKGYKTLLFGPLKPVGLEIDGKRPYAVVQLRRDDKMDKTYNLVGFQTNLLFSEQKRVFSLIPGLENARFLRYGVMHKNIFINSPKVLNSTLDCRNNSNVFFAGQIVGVEGYIESACTGIIAAINVIRKLRNQPLVTPPSTTVIGSLLRYISSCTSKFEPMNANYGVMLGKIEDKIRTAEQSIHDLKEWFNEVI